MSEPYLVGFTAMLSGFMSIFGAPTEGEGEGEGVTLLITVVEESIEFLFLFLDFLAKLISKSGLEIPNWSTDFSCDEQQPTY